MPTTHGADSPHHPPVSIFGGDRAAARAAVRRICGRLNLEEGAEIWHELGAVLASLGDRKSAIIAFRNALRIDGSRAGSQLALGNLLFDSGQCEKALSCFSSAEAVRSSPPA